MGILLATCVCRRPWNGNLGTTQCSVIIVTKDHPVSPCVTLCYTVLYSDLCVTLGGWGGSPGTTQYRV